MPSRNDVVEETRKWLGTPYHHQAALKGIGADCLGLVRGVWIALWDKTPIEPPSYSPDWGEGGTEEVLLNAAKEHMREVPIEEMQAGQVVIFRVYRHAIAKHCGILISTDKMIHAHSNQTTCEVHLTNHWKQRIVGVFDFPDVES